MKKTRTRKYDNGEYQWWRLPVLIWICLAFWWAVLEATAAFLF